MSKRPSLASGLLSVLATIALYLVIASGLVLAPVHGPTVVSSFYAVLLVGIVLLAFESKLEVTKRLARAAFASGKVGPVLSGIRSVFATLGFYLLIYILVPHTGVVHTTTLGLLAAVNITFNYLTGMYRSRTYELLTKQGYVKF